jgi:CBS domain-containing protein
MQVRELMNDSPQCCTADMNLQQAAKMMVDCNCGALPVVQEQGQSQPVGIITDRDIACRCVAEGKDPGSTKVSQCMTQNVETIPPDASIEECCDIMEKTQVRRLIVADGDQIRGIVAQADLVLHLPQDKAAEVVKRISKPTSQPSAAH